MSENESQTKEEEIVVKEAPEAAPEPEQEASDEISPDVGIEALRHQLEMERQARSEAERRAKMAESTASKASMEVQDSNLQLIASAIDSVNRSSQMMKRDYAAAMAAGNFEHAAEIQSHMSLNAAKLLQLENGKAALEQRIANPPPRQQEAPTDPVEMVASQLSPRSAAWVRAHPECVRDQKLYMKMVGAHNIAIADGYVADTDAYFEQIERQMGFRKPQTAVSKQEIEEPTSMAAKPSAPKAPPPAAPSSRAASNGSGGRNTVTLSSAEREMASIMGMTPEEYAKNKVALKKEGKLQ
jgi:hypothetical protein